MDSPVQPPGGASSPPPLLLTLVPWLVPFVLVVSGLPAVSTAETHVGSVVDWSATVGKVCSVAWQLA